MNQIANKVQALSPSMTLSITAAAAKLKKEGVDVCSFGAGEPDFDTPQHIKEAAVQALADGKTKYTAAEGLLELREAICAKLVVDNALIYRPDQVSVNCGAKHSCYNAVAAVCDEGDEVIVPAPYWTSYPEMVKLAGGVPVIVETKQENGWKMTADEFADHITPRTKMVILNSPGNPTGTVYTRSELEAIAEVALSEDIIVLSDEIYEKLTYNDEEHISIATLGKEIYDLTIVVNGFSKAYSMTGWRLGYTAAPKALAEAMNNIQSHTTSAPATFAQWAAIAALEGDQGFIEEWKGEFDVRRQYMMDVFKTIHNVSVVEPLGAFYYLVNIEKMGLKSVNFCEKLLSREKVACVPGLAFGADNTIRFSYACGLGTINKGLERFKNFCLSL